MAAKKPPISGLAIRTRAAPSETPSPPPAELFDDSCQSITPLSEAGARNTNFNDLKPELRHRIWTYAIQPRVVEMYPSQLKKSQLELFEERILERPDELPHYTFEQLGPLARERCRNLPQKYTRKNCGPARLREIHRLPKLVNEAIKVLIKIAGEDPNHLFDLGSIISAFLSVKIELDYMPCILGLTTLELIVFVRLTFPEKSSPNFKYDDDSDQEYDYNRLSEGIWGLRTNYPIPSLLLVCRESHDVAKQHYKRAFLPHQGAPGTWFSPQNDTLLFKYDKTEGEPHPDWAYDQAWSEAYGHFEKTLRDCYDYKELAIELKNVSIVVHPNLKALHHGYSFTLCLGKLHEMFLCLNKCFLFHTLYTQNAEGVPESAFLPLMDGDKAWESYNALTPRRWQFTRRPSMQLIFRLGNLPAEYSVLDIGEEGFVCASWSRENDKGVFREFNFFDDIIAARKFAARSLKLAVKRKPVARSPRIISNTRFKAEMMKMEDSARCITGDLSCDQPNTVLSEFESSIDGGSKSDDGAAGPRSQRVENKSNLSRRITRSMRKLWSSESDIVMTG